MRCGGAKIVQNAIVGAPKWTFGCDHETTTPNLTRVLISSPWRRNNQPISHQKVNHTYYSNHTERVFGHIPFSCTDSCALLNWKQQWFVLRFCACGGERKLRRRAEGAMSLGQIFVLFVPWARRWAWARFWRWAEKCAHLCSYEQSVSTKKNLVSFNTYGRSDHMSNMSNMSKKTNP